MTSAVRDAANGAEFSAAVRERFGLEGRTLSGDEEAAFTYAGATAARPAGDPTELVVIDIGGGSTELVCGAGGRLGFHVSTQIGVVRHTERHLRVRPAGAPRELAALAADVDAGVDAAVPAAVRARVAGGGGRGRDGDVVRGDRPRARALRHGEGRGPRALARAARRPARAARRAAARASAARSAGCTPTGRRRSSPGSSCSAACSTRSGSARSRSPTATSSGASRWSSRCPRAQIADTPWEMRMPILDVRTMATSLTPAGYSIRR